MAVSNGEMIRIERAAILLKNAVRVFIITGAGISADSNLPTYRGIGGLYNVNETEEGHPIEEALSGRMMIWKPEIPWKYLSKIEEACRNAKFNRGHEVISEMQKYFDVWVLTQNIDGFHFAAGSGNVIDIHGDLHNLYCITCERKLYREDYSSFSVIPPKCNECGGVIRPDVVLFGERLSDDKCNMLMEAWQKPFDLVITIGTTSVFPYISQPVLYARQLGVPTIEINPGRSEVSDVVDYKISAGAAESLELLWDFYMKSK